MWILEHIWNSPVAIPLDLHCQMLSARVSPSVFSFFWFRQGFFLLTMGWNSNIVACFSVKLLVVKTKLKDAEFSFDYHKWFLKFFRLCWNKLDYGIYKAFGEHFSFILFLCATKSVNENSKCQRILFLHR